MPTRAIKVWNATTAAWEDVAVDQPLPGPTGPTGPTGAIGPLGPTGPAGVISPGTLLDTPIFLGPEERCNVVAAAATGTINLNVLTSAVWFYTSNATANHTLNIRGDGSNTLNSTLAVGDSVTVVWLNTNGATPFFPNVIQIDGSTVTPRWAGGTAPTGGNASSIDAYSFTIFKTAATPTYTVLGGQTRFA